MSTSDLDLSLDFDRFLDDFLSSFDLDLDLFFAFDRDLERLKYFWISNEIGQFGTHLFFRSFERDFFLFVDFDLDLDLDLDLFESFFLSLPKLSLLTLYLLSPSFNRIS